MKAGFILNILHNQTLLRHFYYIYAVLFILFLFYFFSGIEVLRGFVDYLAVGVLVISWMFSSRLFKMIGGLFIVVGTLFTLTSGGSAGEIIGNTTSNLPLLLFFSVLPWIGTVVRVGGLDASITDMIQDRANRVENIYGRSVVTSYFLAVFLNISAIYIIQNVLRNLFKNSTESFRNEFIIKATLRAFSLAVIWSPLEVIVGLTVDSTGVSYFTLLPWLLVTSIIVGMTEVFLTRREFRGITIEAPFDEIDSRALRKSIIKMLVLLVSFLITVMFFNTNSELGFVMTIALIIIPFSFAAAFVMKRLPIFMRTGWKTWKEHNNHMQNFSVLFLSLGIFSGGFNSSAVPDMMQQVFGYVDSFLILILLLIMAVIYGLAMVGVHPVATLAILAEVLIPVLTPENALSISITMVVCGMSISAAAPYGINATMTAQSMGINPYRITKMNIGFSVRMGLTGILIAMIALIV
ncbi:Citrate transporter-like domain-containing protein [Lacicoccus alkaliphilus]|uniref:Uncharacterized protein n=1 Tax=Lacicoccus alkaliphilus DSM 16010 TaxID=1123231 RepID=A0A1M7EGI8_9BACL|nr:hypothetical protein SAMN02745189_01218 [Salinicoccus alkaliphilus DSM 16010]